jgi:hypothetical protein
MANNELGVSQQDVNELLSEDAAIAKARLRKATKIAECVLRDAIKQSIRVLDDMNDESWQTMALQSGVNAKTTPSAESRRLVKELLEGAKL